MPREEGERRRLLQDVQRLFLDIRLQQFAVAGGHQDGDGGVMDLERPEVLRCPYVVEHREQGLVAQQVVDAGVGLLLVRRDADLAAERFDELVLAGLDVGLLPRSSQTTPSMKWPTTPGVLATARAVTDFPTPAMPVRVTMRAPDAGVEASSEASSAVITSVRST